MAQPSDVTNDIAGVSANGTPEPWRRVLARHPRNIGDVVNDPSRGPWNSTHNGQQYQGTFDAYEQLVTVAEQVSWVHTFSNGKTYDAGDILIGLGEFLIKQGIL